MTVKNHLTTLFVTVNMKFTENIKLRQNNYEYMIHCRIIYTIFPH